MRSSILISYYICNIAIFIENTVCYICSESFRIDFFNLIPCSLQETPEHLLFFILKLELYHTSFKLVIPVFLVVCGIDFAIFIKNRYSESIISVMIGSFITFYFFLHYKTLERPVLDLHRVIIVVDEMTIVDPRHISCHGDQIIKS